MDNRTLSVAVMQLDSAACGSFGGWATHGWWNLNPGEAKTVISTTNRYAFFYARAVDGRWWGDATGPRMYVNPHAKFDSCVSIGTNTWDLVNAARADLGTNMQNTHTVNLNP